MVVVSMTDRSYEWICSLCTSLCLQYEPHYIAAGSVFLAAEIQKVKLPTEEGNVWWVEFDVSPKQLDGWLQVLSISYYFCFMIFIDVICCLVLLKPKLSI